MRGAGIPARVNRRQERLRYWCLFLAGLFCGAALCAQAGLPPEQIPAKPMPVPEVTLAAPIAALPLTAPPPSSAAVLTNFVDTGTLESDPSKATVRVWLDAIGLNVDATVRDRDIRAPHGERDAAHHEGDVLELFLQADPDKTFYFELQAAPTGAVADIFMLDRYWGTVGTANMPEWDIRGLEMNAEARGTVNDGSDVDEGYHLRFRIPAAALKGNKSWPPHATDRWRANFVIMDFTTGSNQPRIWHWSPSLRGGFPHLQERFGWIHFEEVSK